MYCKVAKQSIVRYTKPLRYIRMLRRTAGLTDGCEEDKGPKK